MSVLTDYIRDAKANGASDEAITANLRSAGWDEVQIAEGLTEFKSANSKFRFVFRYLDFFKLNPGSDKIWKYGKIGLVLVAVAVLGFGGLKAYSYFSSNPQKIWADASKKMLNIKSAKFKFDISYSEPQAKNNEESTEAMFFSGDLRLGIKADGSLVLHPDQTNADYDMTSNLNAKFGGFSVSFDFLSRKVGDNLYYKLDGNPFASLFGTSGNTNPGTNTWLKIDLNSSDKKELAAFNLQKDQILDAFKKSKLLKPDKLIGTENIEGTQTWHYSAQLDKQELKSYFESLQKLLDKDQLEDLDAVLDKIEFQKLELWIGKSDHLVHQALLISNSPSIIYSSLESAQNKSRDAKRLANIRQILTALELFFSDNGHYPQASNGLPTNSDTDKQKFSTYLANFPSAPTPADGNCTETTNKYTYESEGRNSFKINFCLGYDYGGYKAGVMEATVAGIRTVTPSNTGAGPSDLIEAAFTGTIELRLNLSDFNTDIKIEEPKNNILDTGESSRDSIRRADILEVMTALELFYNDNDRYPTSISGQPLPTDGTGTFKLSTYLKSYPIPPNPPDGTCSVKDNIYNYQQLDGGSSYQITFCLGSKTQGLEPGVHKASPSGLE